MAPSPRSARTLAETAGAADENVFRLYVCSASPVSSRAVVNARKLFETLLPGRHRLLVLDIAVHLASARADQVVASPTLIRVFPLPQRRFIGDMSNPERLSAMLGLRGPAAT